MCLLDFVRRFGQWFNCFIRQKNPQEEKEAYFEI